MEQHTNYMFNLYQQPYPHWSLPCHSADDGRPVHPTKVREVMSHAETLKNLAIALLSISITLVFLSLSNLLAISFHKLQMCSKKSTRCYGIFRLIITILSCLSGAGVVILLFSVSNTKTVKYLADNKCSTDELLN